MAKRRRRANPKHRAYVNRIRPHYERLFEEQGGVCAICRRPPKTRRLDIDHQHTEPLRYRGLLCARCNMSLREWMTEAWLRGAADYLERPTPEWLLDILK